MLRSGSICVAMKTLVGVFKTTHLLQIRMKYIWKGCVLGIWKSLVLGLIEKVPILGKGYKYWSASKVWLPQSYMGTVHLTWFEVHLSGVL